MVSVTPLQPHTYWIALHDSWSGSGVRGMQPCRRAPVGNLVPTDHPSRAVGFTLTGDRQRTVDLSAASIGPASSARRLMTADIRHRPGVPTLWRSTAGSASRAVIPRSEPISLASRKSEAQGSDRAGQRAQERRLPVLQLNSHAREAIRCRSVRRAPRDDTAAYSARCCAAVHVAPS